MKPTTRHEWQSPWSITLSISDERPGTIRVATSLTSGAEIDVNEAKALIRTLKVVIREAQKADARRGQAGRADAGHHEGARQSAQAEGAGVMTAQRCPVCNGRGTVPAGFYHGPTTSANPDPCRSCDGRGYVVAPIRKQYDLALPMGGRKVRVVQ